MSTAKHGFIKKGSGLTTEYMAGDGNWVSTGSITITNFSNATHGHNNANNGNQLGRNALSYPAFPFVAFTAPVSGDFAWINQGTATIDTATISNAIILLAPANASQNVRLRKKAAPAVPYTITACVVPYLNSVSYNAMGLAFRQSSDGKLALFYVYYNGGLKWRSVKYTDATTFSAEYANGNLYDLAINQGCFYMRIADDNTNRICSISADGINWVVCHSVTRTDFLTADEVGFMAESGNASYAAGLDLLSWLEA